ncbi:uncharacterized protein LACBIDRAFT_294479 [Laccaria bicolor S238N-H82]|uniref:Predicted protein n=1 Tax=Laccaria bicolor (strain S238N-H82 / ATCC MYA-4686) TaxID=486041 RepID=B0DCC0_LACBS|nr:uncharacterized protein LACBIDRAFT_294479 [Laccaria bicolor S238N-H82]EDR07872.1 predicted protein [Laccaria bicolor S238N-H82]|eukprot:XP_001881661.1 predicted protein [Laccaria bicolor S238N-H82]
METGKTYGSLRDSADCTFECIVNAILDQRKSAKGRISHVVLVGGFAASNWLSSEVQRSLKPFRLNIFRPDNRVNKAVSDGAVSFHLNSIVRSRICKVAYGLGVAPCYDSTNPEHLKRSSSMFQTLSGVYRIPKGFSNILPAKTAVSEKTEFRCGCTHASETKLTEFHSYILCYRGELPDPEWLDVDADVSRMKQPPLPRVDGTGGKYYRVDYDVILLFGLTELQAQVAWEEDGVEKRAHTTISDPIPPLGDQPKLTRSQPRYAPTTAPQPCKSLLYHCSPITRRWESSQLAQEGPHVYGITAGYQEQPAALQDRIMNDFAGRISQLERALRRVTFRPCTCVVRPNHDGGRVGDNARGQDDNAGKEAHRSGDLAPRASALSVWQTIVLSAFSMDEPPSSLLKSRIPRKTIIVDPNLFTDDEESEIDNFRCPLQRGIIYYHRDGPIFEHNIHFSGKHEPRIIVPRHPSRRVAEISFAPIKGNRILLFAKYLGRTTSQTYLHLSIHEIRSDNRVGRAAWSFNGSADGHSNIFHLKLIKSTENPLGITFGVRFIDHWKLYDISTTETDASHTFPLIESGRIDHDLKLNSKSKHDSLVILSPDRHILLNAAEKERVKETIDIHYSDSTGDTNNLNFSFVSRMSIPIPMDPKTFPIIQAPVLAFSADGSKFAMAMARSRVSVWEIRSKVPLKTFMDVPKSEYDDRPARHLQFSSGKLGKEVLVFVEHDTLFRFNIIHVIDATSFETEETLVLPLEGLGKPGIRIAVDALFFDPSGSTMYAEINGTLYEWDLQKNKPGPEWWIGE